MRVASAQCCQSSADVPCRSSDELLGRSTAANAHCLQVQAANSLAARRGFSPEQVAFVVGDALAPDLPDASFDLVVSVEAAAYMPDKACAPRMPAAAQRARLHCGVDSIGSSSSAWQ